LLFFSCGTEDNRIEGMAKVAELLNASKIPTVLKRYPGEHEWKVWRHSLVDMAQLLWR
jgi:enterochelin esterase-like enzyme